MHALRSFRTLLPFALALFALGCSKAETSNETSSSDLPERFHLAAEPAGAQPVGAVHASAKEGDAVVVVGTVGGSPNAFVRGAAAFTVVDPSLKSCVGDGMGCTTPWDYCCEDPTSLAKHTATIEFRDAGKVLAAMPQGFHGLDHLKTIVVKGTAHRDAQGNLTVVADGVYVKG